MGATYKVLHLFRASFLSVLMLTLVVLSAFGFIRSREIPTSNNSNFVKTATTSRPNHFLNNYRSEPCDKFTPPDAELMAENGLTLSRPIPASPISQRGSYVDGNGGSGNGSAARFTVLMLVFSRAAALQQLVVHYACMSAVDRMIVLWRQNYPPPSVNNVSSSNTRQQLNCLRKLVIKPVENRGLATRYQNIYTDIHTDAVFSVDDDQLVDESDVNRAFDVWKKHPWGIVGFTKKRYTVSAKSGLINYGGDGPPDYHFLLPNSAFLHRSYIELFDTRLPAEIRQEVDRRMNCDDLAMNLVVSDFCRCTAAFYVSPRRPINGPRTVSAVRKLGGTPETAVVALSSRPKHYVERSECLNSFSRFYNAHLPPNSCIY